jgi:hypothetical protein
MKRLPLGAIIIDFINKLLLNPENINKALERLLTELVTIEEEAITFLLNVFDIQRNQAITLERLADGVALGNELI